MADKNKNYYRLSEVTFANHMETKAKILDPTKVYIGVDFCVMVFAYPYQARAACESMKRSNDNYDYDLEDSAEKLLIYNQHYHDPE
jgi:hypothetical protein